MLDRTWRSGWTWTQGFLLSLAGLVWIHWIYWWEVPTAMWVIPGLSRLPILASLLLLLGLAVGLAYLGLRRVGRGQSWGGLRRLGVLLICLTAWGGLAELPLWLAQRTHPHAPSGHPVKALFLGIDGMRGDFRTQPEFKSFAGVSYPNVYSPLPATRMLYHLLWGGDPEFYSIATVVPSIEELTGEVNLKLLKDAQARGQKVRFFIDDGGTISISGRTYLFDRVTMPARGWENFVNSNLGVRVPLFAAWLDILRVFPTTNPWTNPAAGLHQTLEQGRGADWVIYHSCLAHQPIFLTRKELGEIQGWWKIPANRFKPFSQLEQIEARDLVEQPPAQDPYQAYQIRIRSILKAWAPIWNQLSKDPDYQDAFRVLTSDHGERFYHATKALRLGGVHGYGLDPWELRVPLVVATPGCAQQQVQGPARALSLLDLRDVTDQLLTTGKVPDPARLASRPFAPARFHTLRDTHFRRSLKEYREYTTEGIIKATYILPEGLWAMIYEKPASERGADVSLAKAEEDHLTVLKPLKGGGAEKTEFKGYDLIAQGDIDEKEFQRLKAIIEKEFFRTPWNPSK
ncbi:hypothetical protein [Geothrix fuzhouensis]|uniref:hypothetical protein n=1 Tax=Geothrix fuzhouensis TaxID=2966451 RepID=UPI00214864A1|nr:hypothetical protein [Geothrix fuzhouensis]